MPIKDLEYQFIEEDAIHQMTFNFASRMAVDEWFRIMDDYYKGLKPDDQVRILNDYRKSGLPAMAYTFRRGRAWTSNMPFHPPAKLAIVHSSDVIIPIASILIQNLRFSHLKVNFFREVDKAMAWLKD